MNSSKGSLWRKWDLHLHTPSSFDYHNISVSNQDIIDTLKINEIAVVAITDHHFIDTDRIKELKRLSAGDITILPGIELRSELGGSEAIHYIGIFPEDCDIDYLWKQLEVKLKLTAIDIEQKGNDKVYCDFQESSKEIHELGGIITIHAGSKTNTIENITNALSYKQAIKEDLVNCIDIYEVGKPTDVPDYRKNVFPFINKVLPMVLCSDNHDMKKYRLKENCWIKADPTFLGLKQVLIEPDARVFIGENPEVYKRVDQNRTKYINKIQIDINYSDTYAEEEWFRNVEIDINPELVAIIGNKGNGKSALADIIGLVGNAKTFDQFSFLNTDKFRESKFNRAKHFIGKIVWESEDEDSRILLENPAQHEQEKVKYIPQKYLESLCNDVAKNKFEEELKEVIFSHVPDDQKLGQESLDKLLEHKSVVINDSISNSVETLEKINIEIVNLEVYLDKEYQNVLKEKIKIKTHELEVHEKAKPKEIFQPNTNHSKAEEIRQKNDYLAAKTAEKKIIEEDIKSSHAKKAEILKKHAYLDKAMGEIENFRTQHTSFISRLSESLVAFEIDVNGLVTFEVNEDALATIKSKLEKELREIDDSLNEDMAESLIKKRDNLEVIILELKSKLDEPNQKYQAYLKELEIWGNKKAEMEGDIDKEGTLLNLQSHEKHIRERMPIELTEKRNERVEITKTIFDKKIRIVNILREFYKPVEDFVEKNRKEKYPVKFYARLELVDFNDNFFSFINQKAKGSFYGKEDGTRSLRKLTESIDINKKEDIVTLLTSIINSLEVDSREGNGDERVIRKQLRKDNPVNFYNYLFSLSYVKPEYTLQLGETELKHLSPGEKGALLLIFYLMIDKSDIPLIIDQPEENLDNESVYELLVPYIKLAKQRRQIIIVTHNPNLAVVCDAEQIIYSKIDKKNKNKVSYTPGSIENPDINKKIVDVLEGTMPAFDNRESKYTITRG